ncbi:MAG: OmpA family protein [Alphaproteobacteria bacterium]|nr:OmpA family protein [Alphaproteobacteria bacterium]
MYKKIVSLFLIAMLAACAPYVSPVRENWMQYLNGASFTDMTDTARVAKRPVYFGECGRVVLSEDVTAPVSEYGDKLTTENARIIKYMSELEFALYDGLRKPGISVQRAGSEVVVILVRDAIMELNAAQISATGDDTLNRISKTLKKFDATFIEVAGYTDAMQNAVAANALSSDMAQRVGVYFAQHGINTTRLFIVGRGAARPIAAQDDIGRLTNRRVELRIAPAR